MEWLFVLLILGVWIALSCKMAEARGRDKATWGVVGFLIGPFALILLAILGKTEEQKMLDKANLTELIHMTVPQEKQETM
jgi:hypothetical protein